MTRTADNDEGFIKEFCYIMLIVAALGLVWLFLVGLPMLGHKGLAVIGAP